MPRNFVKSKLPTDIASESKKLKTEAWYTYRAIMRAEKGNTARLHSKLLNATEKLIDCTKEAMSGDLDCKEIEQLSKAILNISQARDIQASPLSGADIIKYLYDTNRLEIVRQGKAGIIDDEGHGVILLPVINKDGKDSKEKGDVQNGTV